MRKGGIFLIRRNGIKLVLRKSGNSAEKENDKKYIFHSTILDFAGASYFMSGLEKVKKILSVPLIIKYLLLSRNGYFKNSFFKSFIFVYG